MTMINSIPQTKMAMPQKQVAFKGYDYEQYKKNVRTQRATLSAVAPGIGQMLKGETNKGFAFLALDTVLLTGMSLLKRKPTGSLAEIIGKSLMPAVIATHASAAFDAFQPKKAE